MVSVIIPNYNHAKYLNERIDSIINQTFQDFEIIILDDKSSDESKIIIEQYRDHPKVSHIVINDINSGSPFIQWKKGIDLAKGDLIWIAESDDYAAPTFLEECVKQILIHTDAAFCFSDSWFVDENSKIIKDHQLEGLTDKPTAEGYIKHNGIDFIENKLLKSNYVYNASMVVFRKEFFNKISGKYTTMKGCGDWVFWGEMATFGSVVKVTKRLNYFRHHTGSTTLLLKISKKNQTENVESILYLTSIAQVSRHTKLTVFGKLHKRLKKVKKKDIERFNKINEILNLYCNYRTKAYIYYQLKIIINPLRKINRKKAH